MIPVVLDKDCVSAHIEGEAVADQFIVDLHVLAPAGDDLHKIIDRYTCRRSSEDNAFLRGFLRRIQKRLECIA